MRKIHVLCLCLSFLMLLSIGMPAMAAYQPGTYIAEAIGNNGPVKVSVEMDEQNIVSVTIEEHAETVGLSDLPIAQIPEAIVAGQTLAVDMISGATNTSKAILDAAEECIRQAGGDIEALKSAVVQEEEEQQIDLTTDVVVVGAGISGLSAAIAAREAGAEVILLEKQGVVGGSLALAAGGFASVGSYLEIEQGIQDSAEDAVERWMAWGKLWGIQHPEGRDGWPVKEKITYIAENMAENIDWIKAHGVEFTSLIPATNNLARLFTKGGSVVAQTLLNNAQDAGVQVFTQTPAVDVIIQDDAVIGVVAKNGATTYRIYGNVVLASGGYSANSEMIAEMIPEYTTSISVAAVGDTGDGIKMALDAGAVLYEDPWVISYIPQLAESITGNAQTAGLAGSHTTHLLVNVDGSRIINEFSWYAAVSNAIAVLSDGTAYSIFDSSDADITAMLEAGLETGEVLKANTLAELAEIFGADGEHFADQVARYNTVAETGEDTEFPLASTAVGATSTQSSSPYTSVVEAPYYALRIYCAHMGTMGGVVTNNDACVLNAEGSPIAGLWAAGEMSNRAFYDHTYLGAVSLASYTIMGRTAGQNAAVSALAE